MGLLLENPAIKIEWRMKLSVFLSVFPSDILHKVTANYFTASCVSHEGMQSMIGFHFGEFPLQSNEPLLYDIEFFRTSYPDAKVSFDEFQKHFEKVYGSGQVVEHSSGFPVYRWVIPGAEIKHGVYERFGPEEHLHIYC